MNNDKQHEIQEIDIVELWRNIWSYRRKLLIAVTIAFVIGIIIAFSIPKEYTTQITLAPESKENNTNGNIIGLAAMAGINLNSQSGPDAISPILYPSVVASTPFIVDLFDIGVTDKNNSVTTLYEYADKKIRSPWWNSILGLPGKLLGGKGKNKNATDKTDSLLIRLNDKQMSVLKTIQNRINVSVDKKTQIISVVVNMQDPEISAQTAQIVTERLQKYITEYRTRKARRDLEFTEKVLADAKDKYYKAQRSYAHFEDANRNLISATYRTEEERLHNEMTLAFNVYNTLAQKLEEDKLQVQEQTPIYAIIQPAIVPIKASSPRKLIIIIGCICIILFLSIGYILIRDIFK